jgi:2-methylisocitrate lyase-like PEP mutase family enzyme
MRSGQASFRLSSPCNSDTSRKICKKYFQVFVHNHSNMRNSADFAARRETFHKLHEAGCFVIPNPWDPGSARYLQHIGFQALATTSAGFAFSRALPDDERAVGRDNALSNIADIVAAVDLPVNADFASGFARAPDDMAENVRLCLDTGVAGLSVEDATGDGAHPLYELPLAIDRITAARAAIDESGSGVLLTARAECYLVGHPEPFKESLRRLEEYAEAGADVLYAPGLIRREDIKAVVSALQPKPVNILVSRTGPSVAELADLGVRRISVGSALARVAWNAFMRAAQTLAREGSFAGFEGAAAHAELNRFFAEGMKGP